MATLAGAELARQLNAKRVNHAMAAASTDGAGPPLASLFPPFPTPVIYPPSITPHAGLSPGSFSLTKSSFLSPPYPSPLPPSFPPFSLDFDFDFDHD